MPPGLRELAQLVTGIVAPGSRPVEPPLECSSDRKRFMVLQVKTMSSHQRAAGRGSGRPGSRRGPPARGHRRRSARRSPGMRSDSGRRPERGADAERVPRAVRVPVAARRPHAVRRRHRGERIRHPELTVASRTSAWASWRRRQPAELARPRRRLHAAIPSAVGARPSSTNWPVRAGPDRRSESFMRPHTARTTNGVSIASRPPGTPG